MKVVVRILHAGSVDPSLCAWMMWAAKKYHLWDIDLWWAAEGNTAARNHVVSDFLNGDGDRLWLIDSGVTPPRSNAIIKHDFPVLCGSYGSWSNRHGALPSVYRMDNAAWGAYPFNEWPNHKVFKADGAALGCVVMQRQLLADLEDPWFHYGSEGFPYDSPDQAFSRRVQGVHVLRDYICRHAYEVDITMEIERGMMANLAAYALKNNLITEPGTVDPPEVPEQEGDIT